MKYFNRIHLKVNSHGKFRKCHVLDDKNRIICLYWCVENCDGKKMFGKTFFSATKKGVENKTNLKLNSCRLDRAQVTSTPLTSICKMGKSPRHIVSLDGRMPDFFLRKSNLNRIRNAREHFQIRISISCQRNRWIISM